jgi:uncharacterized protein YuzE
MNKTTYDQEADAMYIKVNRGKYEVSEEIEEGIVLDFDKKGKIIGVEILNVRGRLRPNILKKLNHTRSRKQ